MAGPDRNIQQIRFLDGTEVLASIIHWEEDTYIEANNILEMIPMEDMDHPDDSKTYYILKPLVMYTDDLSKSTTINPGAIMTVTEPSDTVKAQYASSLAEIGQAMGDVVDHAGHSNVVTFSRKKKLLTED
jgi:hypothetical protein